MPIVPATITYLQNAGAVDANTTHTFSAQNLGTASADRHIICVFSGRAASVSPSLTSITIGGITATISKQANDAIGLDIIAIVIAAVPTGTSGDVVITTSQTMASWDIALYSTTNVGSLIATDTGSSVANPLTYDLDINGGGIGVAAATSDSGVATATWAGLTERYDDATAGGNDKSGASAAFALLETNKTVSCTWSASVRPLYVVASYTPVVTPSNIIYRSSQNTGWNTGTTTVVTKPTGLAVGDLMIANILGTVTGTPSGWTNLGFTTFGGSPTVGAAFYYYKIADSSDVAATNFTWTQSGSIKNFGSISRITGFDTNTVNWVWGGNDKTALNTTTPAVSTNVTPTSPSSLLIQFWYASTATTAISEFAVVTSNPNWLKDYDVADGTSADVALGYAIRPEVTNTGNGSAFGGAGTTDWGSAMISISDTGSSSHMLLMF